MLLLILKVYMSYPLYGHVNDLLVYVQWSFKFWLLIFLVTPDQEKPAVSGYLQDTVCE
jgi:hypothetical protein